MKEKIPAIIGVGSAFPQRVVTNEMVDPMIGGKPGLTDRLMRRIVGIQERRWVIPGEQTTSDLAVEALNQALDMAGIEKEALKSIVVGTSSPDYYGVADAAIIQDRMGLPVSVRGYDVSAGCTGWAQALKNIFSDISSPYGDGGPQVAIGSEILSPALNREERLSFPLFGDGAGATIADLVEPDNGMDIKPVIRCGVDGKFAENLCMRAGGSKNPGTIETMAKGWHTLHMDGKEIGEQAPVRMAEVSKRVLEEANLSIENVTLFIPHQANLSIMKETAGVLNIPESKVIITIDRYGNTSTATIPTALREAWDKGKIKRNDILLFATFGAGLTFAAGILPMIGLPNKK
ncbi:MAG: ketoacyl-ACP synthase III [Candidatus Levybacteria bacterium]|nr:ketoacyl-ACP synthase III [Candidatus Levybacteria bacterium]